MKKRHVGAAWIMSLWISVMLLAPGKATAEHTGQIWQGSQNCQTCHETQANEMYGSTHYQWQGEALDTTNGPGIQGKLTTALNSYCVSILGNWNACGTCHAGLGAMPVATATPDPSQLQNIDCLICHQKDYKRKKVNGVFVPDTANMAITMDQAIQTVHLPVRANCIQCHAKGGGGDNNKRGDMALAHATTTDRNFDVHMSTTGANLTCQQCHTTQNHRIAGRGSDLRQTDLDEQMNCSTAACHSNKTTSTGHTTADVNKHVNRVACQTCHIKTYARNAADTTGTESTEVHRDWTIPVWSAALNRWEPEIFRGSDLKPAYAFWNGTSWNYSLNELSRYEAATGTYATSRPEGGINESGSKLYPFKYKTALQPLATLPDVLVALDTAVYFSTGVYDTAVKAGLVNMGYPNSTAYQTVETDTYQLLTHEVMPKANALTCTQCHAASATQLNLKSTGYAMKGTQNTTCVQCHGNKSIPTYTSLHSKHVASKQYDCSWCHSFSRPERGLKMPAGSDTTAPSVTGFAIPSTATSLTVTISTLSATDNIGVAGYIVTESATKPLATATGWTPAKPASYTFATAGAKTLYAWAKDAAGNVSNARTDQVTITSSTGVANISTGSSLEIGSTEVGESKRKTLEIKNKGTARLTVTKIEVVGTDASAFKPSVTAFNLDRSREYDLRITFKPTARRTFTATLRIYSNDPDTPVKQVALSGRGEEEE
ncbi:MAG: choice-of-anchor D domain-containing protein [Pseudomonadota bacterium]